MIFFFLTISPYSTHLIIVIGIISLCQFFTQRVVTLLVHLVIILIRVMILALFCPVQKMCINWFQEHFLFCLHWSSLFFSAENMSKKNSSSNVPSSFFKVMIGSDFSRVLVWTRLPLRLSLTLSCLICNLPTIFRFMQRSSCAPSWCYYSCIYYVYYFEMLFILLQPLCSYITFIYYLMYRIVNTKSEVFLILNVGYY